MKYTGIWSVGESAGRSVGHITGMERILCMTRLWRDGCYEGRGTLNLIGLSKLEELNETCRP